MKARRYTILLYPDEERGGYTVLVPSLPGVVTEGDTVEEALAMAKEAIELHIEGMIADGEPVPEEDAPPEIRTVVVEAPAA